MSGSYDPDRVRRRLKPFHLTKMYRVIPERHRGTPLGVRAAPSRFSDRAGKFAVLYAADSVPCAVWENMIRDRFIRVKRRTLSKHEVRRRLVVMLTSTEALPLVDLRGDGPIRIAAPTAVAHDTNHAAGRALAATVHDTLPDADGFLYQSRFTGHDCVAVFDRAIRKLRVLNVTPLITHPDLLAALDDYQVVLTEPPI